MSSVRWSAALLGSLALLGACGSDRDSSGPGEAPNNTLGSGGKDAGGNPTCAGSVATASGAPLDMVFLLERSEWMVGPRWDSITRAIVDFSYQGFPVPTRAALSFFPVPRYRPWDFTIDEECPFTLYDSLNVPLGELPGNRVAIENGIASANGQWGMGTNVPLYTALKGTYLATSRIQDENPTHQVVVVLIGSGTVTTCPQYGMVTGDSAKIAELARAALDYNGVRTYAIATSDDGYPLLKTIAEASEGEVLQVPPTIDGVLGALEQIRRTSVECSITLPDPPPGRELDYGEINVAYSSGTGASKRIPAALSHVNCAGGPGWYYDSVTSPKKVILCPATCAPVKNDPQAHVDVVLGCKTEVK